MYQYLYNNRMTYIIRKCYNVVPEIFRRKGVIMKKLNEFDISIQHNEGLFIARVKALNKRTILAILPFLYAELGIDKADVKSVEIEERKNDGCSEEI